MSVNKVILLGNVGKEPVLNETNTGKKVVNFSIATSTKNKAGESLTEWHNIVAWEKTAEIVGTHVTKGQQLYIEGKLQTRKWADKDGKDRWTTEVIANNVTFIGKKDSAAPAAEQTTLDEIPF